LGLLKEASKWKPPIVLDIEDYYDEQYEYLAQRYKTPLIIIDFIDKNRNAAAAISKKSFDLFSAIAKAFIKAPSIKLFEKPEVNFSLEQLISAVKKHNYILLSFAKPQNIVDDIWIPQLRKSEKAIARQIQMQEFEVKSSASLWDDKNCYFLIDFESLELSKRKTILGPPLEMEADVARFISAHKKPLRGPFKKDGKIAVEVERKNVLAQKIVQKVLLDPKSSGVASHFVFPLKKSKLFSEQTLLYELKTNSYLQLKVAELLFSKKIK